MAESVQLDGLQKTVDALGDLDGKVQKTIVRRATRAGAKVILAEARSDVPAQSGRTRANLKIRSGGTSKGFYRLSVGVGAKDFAGPTFYAAFVLFGHKVGSRKLGDARKSVPANNWLLRAFEQTATEATDALSQSFVDQVNEAAGGG